MIRNIPVVATALAFTIAFSQVPVYIQQYEQRLGGAVDELGSVVAKDRENAQGLNMDLDAFIRRHETSPETAFRETGKAMRARTERLVRLEGALERLEGASPWARPFVMARDADPAIAVRAWEAFHFTLALDPVYGLVGLLAGLFFWDLVSWPWRGKRGGLKRRA
jgi:hypothetical protein